VGVEEGGREQNNKRMEGERKGNDLAGELPK